ncbi:glutathione S-transferase family protein, partial [Pelistega suis]|uniref:glutathione S-transferase family protein n=1 Tax=Pelistega suis TaxID=1631957 RepID=UPI00211C810B
PNGVKVSIMLEETGLPYEPHLVRFDQDDQTSPEFLSLNPNNKIPAILDPNGPGGQPLALFESGAIALHLAEQHPGLLPRDPDARMRAIMWVFAALNTVEPPIVERSMAWVLEREQPWYAQRLPMLDERV